MHTFSDTDIWIYVSAGRYNLAECNKQFPRFLLWFQKLKVLKWRMIRSALKKEKKTKWERVKRKKRKTKKNIEKPRRNNWNKKATG